MAEKKIDYMKSPDLSKLREITIDKKTKIYIAYGADVAEAISRYMNRGPSKRVK
jgi:hypothetical protein